MANLFIGFPVPRAKIATMIEEAAPPLNHVPNHLPTGTDPIVDPGDIANGQIIKWDGTKFDGINAPEVGIPVHGVQHQPDGLDPIVPPEGLTNGQILVFEDGKFVAAAAPAAGGYPSPISIHPCDFLAVNNSVDYSCDRLGLRRLTSKDMGEFHGPVFLPHGSTVTKLTQHAFRDHADATLVTLLGRISNTGAINTLASVTADLTTGNQTASNSIISDPVIDNSTYSYLLRCRIHPSTDVQNVKLMGVEIDFTQ